MDSFTRVLDKMFSDFTHKVKDYKKFIDEKVYVCDGKTCSLYEVGRRILGLWSRGVFNKEYTIVIHGPLEKSMAELFDKQVGLWSGILTTHIRGGEEAFQAFTFDKKRGKFLPSAVLIYHFISPKAYRPYKDKNGNIPSFFESRYGFALDIVATEKSFRRKGLASLLFRVATDAIKKSHPDYYVITSTIQSPVSKKLAEKLGIDTETYKDRGKPVGVLERAADLKKIKTKWKPFYNKRRQLSKYIASSVFSTGV